jgi:hypothetical protein
MSRRSASNDFCVLRSSDEKADAFVKA